MVIDVKESKSYREPSVNDTLNVSDDVQIKAFC